MSSPHSEVPLGDVISLKEDKVPVSPEVSYNIAGVYSFGRGLFTRGPLSGGETTYKFFNRLHEHDLVLSRLKGWEGALGIVPNSLNGWFLSPQFATFRLDPRKIDVSYLEYFCRLESVWNQLRQTSRGMGARRDSVSPESLLRVKIPLPPLDEQRRIVDRAQRLLSRTQQSAELRAQALQSVEIAWRSIAENTIARIQSEEDKPIGELVSIRGGGTPSKGNPYFWQGSIPWVSPKDMKQRVIRDSKDHISEEAVANSPAKILTSGCVLIVTRGMILAHTVPAAVLMVPASINQDMKALMPKPRIKADYLCTILWGLNARILELVERSTHDTRKLETDKLLGFRIPVPSLAEQEHLVSQLAAMEVKIQEVEQLQRESELLIEALAPSILDKAFKGEL